MVGAIGRLRTPATNRLIIQGRTQALASPHRWLGRQLGREPDRGLQRTILAPGSLQVLHRFPCQLMPACAASLGEVNTSGSHDSGRGE